MCLIDCLASSLNFRAFPPENTRIIGSGAVGMHHHRSKCTTNMRNRIFIRCPLYQIRRRRNRELSSTVVAVSVTMVIINTSLFMFILFSYTTSSIPGKKLVKRSRKSLSILVF
jgi:hypothetical protein